MLTSLALPIVVAAVALFFASFLSWMVLQLHKQDWVGVPREDELMADVAKQNLPPGNYMFPYCPTHQEMKSEAFQRKYTAGPRGILTIMPPANMGQMLGLTILYFLVVAFGIAYLASVAFKPGEAFLEVFRFVFTAGLFIFLAATLQHAIWFKSRVVGHVIESIAYALITAAIFASMWPKA